MMVFVLSIPAILDIAVNKTSTAMDNNKNNSSYAPNNYLLSETDKNGKTQFVQRPLNQTIEYDKWYKIRLNITATAISFYFDGRPITTLSRPSGNDMYTSIHLIGESAAVSFKNMVIE